MVWDLRAGAKARGAEKMERTQSRVQVTEHLESDERFGLSKAFKQSLAAHLILLLLIPAFPRVQVETPDFIEVEMVNAPESGETKSMPARSETSSRAVVTSTKSGGATEKSKPGAKAGSRDKTRSASNKNTPSRRRTRVPAKKNSQPSRQTKPAVPEKTTQPPVRKAEVAKPEPVKAPAPTPVPAPTPAPAVVSTPAPTEPVVAAPKVDPLEAQIRAMEEEAAKRASRRADKTASASHSTEKGIQIPATRRSLASRIDEIDPDSAARTLVMKTGQETRKIETFTETPALRIADGTSSQDPQPDDGDRILPSAKRVETVTSVPAPDAGERRTPVMASADDIMAGRTERALPQTIASAAPLADREPADLARDQDASTQRSEPSVSMPSNMGQDEKQEGKSPLGSGMDVIGAEKGVDGDRDSIVNSGIGSAAPSSDTSGGSLNDSTADLEMSVMDDGQGRYSEPRLIYYLAPAYPAWAEEKGLFGRVTLKIMVNDLGVVTDSLILESSVTDRRMADIARNASLKWKFARILLDGKPVSAAIRMVINFKLKGR